MSMRCRLWEDFVAIGYISDRTRGLGTDQRLRVAMEGVPIDLMSTVIVSRYQIIIPPQVREMLEIHSGQEIEVLAHDGRIEIIPIKPMRAMRGFIRDIEYIRRA